jgi:hypothetical protein
MSKIVSAAQGGIWSARSTWGGVPVPHEGDTVAVNGTVTVDRDADVGSRPAAKHDAIVIHGSLVVSELVTLVVQGDISVASGGSLVLEPGARLRFNSSHSPKETNYRLNLGEKQYDVAVLICRGTELNPCCVESDQDGCPAYIKHRDGYITGQVVAQYTVFDLLGDSAVNSVHVYAQDKHPVTFDFCSFNRCGLVSAVGPRRHDLIRFDTCRWRNPLGEDAVKIPGHFGQFTNNLVRGLTSSRSRGRHGGGSASGLS